MKKRRDREREREREKTSTYIYIHMTILKNVTGKKLVVHEEIKEEKTFYK
jgi:hypothetical protein